MFMFYPNMNTYLVAFPNFSYIHIEHGASPNSIEIIFLKKVMSILLFSLLLIKLNELLLLITNIQVNSKDLQLVNQYLFRIILPDY